MTENKVEFMHISLSWRNVFLYVSYYNNS